MPPFRTAQRSGSVSHSQASLPPLRSSARTARVAVDELLWSTLSGEQLETVKLLASELVTNAVVHAGTPCDVRLTHTPDGVVRLEVSDAEPEMPATLGNGAASVGGNGLVLIDALATRWGVERAPADGTGKTVWVELRW